MTAVCAAGWPPGNHSPIAWPAGQEPGPVRAMDLRNNTIKHNSMAEESRRRKTLDV